MLTFWGDRQRYCDGISRRNFLQLGAFGAGLTLADVLRLKAQDPAAAQKANEFDMDGHAAKAKDAIKLAVDEIKLAAEAANKNAPAK